MSPSSLPFFSTVGQRCVNVTCDGMFVHDRWVPSKLERSMQLVSKCYILCCFPRDEQLYTFELISNVHERFYESQTKLYNIFEPNHHINDSISHNLFALAHDTDDLHELIYLHAYTWQSSLCLLWVSEIAHHDRLLVFPS